MAEASSIGWTVDGGYSLKEIDAMRDAIARRRAEKRGCDVDEIDTGITEIQLRTYILAGIRLSAFEGVQTDA